MLKCKIVLPNYDIINAQYRKKNNPNKVLVQIEVIYYSSEIQASFQAQTCFITGSASIISAGVVQDGTST